MAEVSAESGGVRVRHRVEHAALAALGAVFRALPRRVALGVGAILGRALWATRVRRRRVLANLAQALPEASAAERRRIGARAARSFGRTVAEFLRFERDRERIGELVEIDGLPELRAAIAEGRGVVLVTAHLGSWALYVTALAAAGVPSALLVGQQRNPLVQRLILAIPGGAVELVERGRHAPRALLRAVRAGRAIVMVADHYSSDQRVYVPFLGKDAYTLTLPGALVARHRMPLLAMTGHRVDGDRHRLEIRRVETPAGPDDEETRWEVARRMNAALGAAILAHPDQYFWYHDRWKVRRLRLRASVTDTEPR